MSFFKLDFCENHPPARHVRYKVVDFAPINKSIWQIGFLQPIWYDFFKFCKLSLLVCCSCYGIRFIKLKISHKILYILISLIFHFGILTFYLTIIFLPHPSKNYHSPITIAPPNAPPPSTTSLSSP